MYDLFKSIKYIQIASSETKILAIQNVTKIDFQNIKQ